MKKIEVITLKEREFLETEEGYVEAFKNEKKYPVFLTNYALRKGYDLGLIKSTLIADLLKISTVEDGATEKEQGQSALETFDERKILNVIYLAFLGANRNSNLDVDDFTDRYHASYTDQLELYINLIKGAIENSTNSFAKGLEKSTQRPSSNEKK